MKQVFRWTRLAALAAVAFAVTGCCVLPFGEGRGHRHYSDYPGAAHGNHGAERGGR